jgi:hypothetical protein
VALTSFNHETSTRVLNHNHQIDAHTSPPCCLKT